jgi:hypothetical protein
MTIHEAEAYYADAMAAGASAEVPKRTVQRELLPTLMALLPYRMRLGRDVRH